jgi:hypothetical protein
MLKLLFFRKNLDPAGDFRELTRKESKLGKNDFATSPHTN